MLGSDIINLVVVKMEEYTPYGPDSGEALLAGGDNLDEVKPVYSYIHQNLAQAANEMLAIAPIHKLLYKEENVIGVADEEDNQIGSIALPSDFLRVHTLWMKGWRRPIHDALIEGHPISTLQYTKWTRGTKQKPVGVLDGRGQTRVVYDDQTVQHKMSFTSGNDYALSWYDGWNEPVHGFELRSHDEITLWMQAEFHSTPAPDAPSGTGSYNGDWSTSIVLKKGERKFFNITDLIDNAASEAGHPMSAEWFENVEVWVNNVDSPIEIDVYSNNTNMHTESVEQRELHYYSVDAAPQHEVKVFRYVPQFNTEHDYDRGIAELIALHCARKIYEIYGNTELIGVITNEINSVLENLRQ